MTTSIAYTGASSTADRPVAAQSAVRYRGRPAPDSYTTTTGATTEPAAAVRSDATNAANRLVAIQGAVGHYHYATADIHAATSSVTSVAKITCARTPGSIIMGDRHMS